MKTKSFKEFKEFLATNCWSEKLYGDGAYDRKIYNWFTSKPRKKVTKVAKKKA